MPTQLTATINASGHCQRARRGGNTPSSTAPTTGMNNSAFSKELPLVQAG